MSRRPFRNRTDFIVWHCAATRPSWNGGAADIDTMHRKNGWDGIGYHFVIRRDGRIETGEDLAKVGAHVQGHNSVSVGVCLVGGVDEKGKAENNFTAAQWESAKVLYQLLSLIYREASHCGHRDLSPDKNGDGVIKPGEWLKMCPCFSVKDWEKNGLKPVSGVNDSTPTPVPKPKKS